VALATGLTDKGATAVAVAAFLGATGARVGAFPNVTFPGFTAFAEAQLQLAQARALSFNPLLPAAQLAGWTAYARGHLGELGAPASALGTINATAFRTGVYERNASNAAVPSAPGRAFTTPVWQIAPFATNEAAVFYNLHSQVDRQHALDTALTSRLPAVTNIITLVQDRAGNVSRASGIVFAPVFDAAAADPTAVVGFTSVVFSWDSFLAASLPAFITGIDAVLSSAGNNATFTFRIVRGSVVSTAAGDRHERELERLVQTTSLDDAGLGQSFTIRLYPTTELRDSYLSSNPQNACIGVVCIIVAVALVFRLYDLAVIYHSGELAAVASIASHIVDGVFPETVRNRLFRHHAAAVGGTAAVIAGGSSGGDQRPSSGESAGAGAPGRGHSSGLSAAVKFMRKLAQHNNNTPRQSFVEQQQQAIADHFDHCTVLFADLVSFTQWASGVPPERVFAVLEAVFGQFDTAARKFGVFKVQPLACVACVACVLARFLPF
jgi:hypothetical protein